MNNDKEQNYFKKLINGDISLSTTFWVWFLSVFIFFSFFSDYNFDETKIHASSKDQIVAIVFLIVTITYSIFIFVAVLKSAKKYLGSKLWSFLAQVIVSINLIFALFALLDVFKIYIFEDYAIANQIKNFKKKLPIKIDSYTELKEIDKDEKNIFYTYKLHQIDLSNNNAFNINKFKDQIIDSVCEDSNTLDLLKKDYVLKYSYLDKSDKKIVNVNTTKEACGKSIYDLDILRAILDGKSSF